MTKTYATKEFYGIERLLDYFLRRSQSKRRTILRNAVNKYVVKLRGKLVRRQGDLLFLTIEKQGSHFYVSKSNTYQLGPKVYLIGKDGDIKKMNVDNVDKIVPLKRKDDSQVVTIGNFFRENPGKIFTTHDIANIFHNHGGKVFTMLNRDGVIERAGHKGTYRLKEKIENKIDDLWPNLDEQPMNEQPKIIEPVVKRGRGRPRKIQAVIEPVVIEPVVKRGRGRPRKAQVPSPPGFTEEGEKRYIESLEALMEKPEVIPEPIGKDNLGRLRYQVVCDSCGQDTDVPFIPDGIRKCYCRHCHITSHFYEMKVKNSTYKVLRTLMTRGGFKTEDEIIAWFVMHSDIEQIVPEETDRNSLIDLMIRKKI